MATLLRLTALLSFLWVIVLVWIQPASDPNSRALANALAIAHLGFALLFLRAAANPSAERSAIYVALLILGLRAAVGTYHALYSLQGAAALLGLADMTLSVALFVGITNTLAETLRPPADE